MKTLKLDTYLEPTDMGNDQKEISDYVMNCKEWLDYVDTVNKEGIPSDDGETPNDSWLEDHDFHPDQLISKACQELEWTSTPQTGGFIMHFYNPSDFK